MILACLKSAPAASGPIRARIEACESFSGDADCRYGLCFLCHGERQYHGFVLQGMEPVIAEVFPQVTAGACCRQTLADHVSDCILPFFMI